MILVLVTFSMVNFVFPPDPAILPMARDKWSPLSGRTEANQQRSGKKKQTVIWGKKETDVIYTHIYIGGHLFKYFFE